MITNPWIQRELNRDDDAAVVCFHWGYAPGLVDLAWAAVMDP